MIATKTKLLACAGALLMLPGASATAKQPSPCAMPMPVGGLFAVRDVTLSRRLNGKDNQTVVFGTVVTRDRHIAAISVFYVPFRGDHPPLSEDGTSHVALAPTGCTGPRAALRMARIGGSPKLFDAPPASVRVLAVVTWRDPAGAEQWEAHFVPFRLID